MVFETIMYTSFITPAQSAFYGDNSFPVVVPSGVVDRTHRRLFKLNDKIGSLDREIRLVEAELGHHRSINDDAQRDAAVGNYIDRDEAGLTRGDVRRFETTLARLREKRGSAVAKRDELLRRLPD